MLCIQIQELPLKRLYRQILQVLKNLISNPVLGWLRVWIGSERDGGTVAPQQQFAALATVQ